MPETQVLFCVEKELLEALDTILSAEGFKTKNEWFRAQTRRALDDALCDSLSLPIRAPS